METINTFIWWEIVGCEPTWRDMESTEKIISKHFQSFATLVSRRRRTQKSVYRLKFFNGCDAMLRSNTSRHLSLAFSRSVLNALQLLDKNSRHFHMQNALLKNRILSNLGKSRPFYHRRNDANFHIVWLAHPGPWCTINLSFIPKYLLPFFSSFVFLVCFGKCIQLLSDAISSQSSNVVHGWVSEYVQKHATMVMGIARLICFRSACTYAPESIHHTKATAKGKNAAHIYSNVVFCVPWQQL